MNATEYEKRRDYFLKVMRKQNAMWERNIEMEEKARKPLRQKTTSDIHKRVPTNRFV
jgi:hypothetical protein